MGKVSIIGLVVLVTGTNREKGIGRALVLEAIHRGAKKVYAAARDVNQLEPLVANYPDKIIPIQLDVTNKEHIAEAVKLASDTQVLVNNAGAVTMTGGISTFDYDEQQKEFEVNYYGPVNLTRAFIDVIRKNGNGAIVNISSVGALTPFPNGISYCVSKAALHMYSQGIRIELHPENISVFCVYPGPIDTDMAKNVPMEKESTSNAVKRIYDRMEQGIDNITTDAFADNFEHLVRKDSELNKILTDSLD